jgi:multidrug resistance efflux pump
MQARATLQQARATLAQARASRDFARVTADRWDQIEARELAAHRDADQQRSAFAVSQANLQAALCDLSMVGPKSESNFGGDRHS